MLAWIPACDHACRLASDIDPRPCHPGWTLSACSRGGHGLGHLLEGDRLVRVEVDFPLCDRHFSPVIWTSTASRTAIHFMDVHTLIHAKSHYIMSHDPTSNASPRTV